MKIYILSIFLCTITLLGCSGQKTQETQTSTNLKQIEPARAPQLTVFRGGDEREAQALAIPFEGVTSNGKIREGLFPVKVTGVSTEPVRLAAEAFLAALNQEELAKCTFPIDDHEWRKWHNIHPYKRAGIGLIDMNENQKALAFKLLTQSLSAKGLKKSKNIMALEGHIAYVLNNYDEYGEERYYFTFMGSPSDTEPWGWQLDGHHLIINYFILGDQVVMTPTFMGTEPVKAEEGPFAGTREFEAEEQLGLQMIQALTSEQQLKAILLSEKTHNYNQTEAFRDNAQVPYMGILAKELDKKQQKKLLILIEEYIGNMDDGHAKVKMEEIKEYLDETYFAWIGGTEAESVFYYRIHSPVVLIEFDHQGPIALKGERGVPTRNHIHTVVRTPNGNDYGKDLLKQHLETHHH